MSRAPGLSVSAVIPAYNEELGIELVVRGVKAALEGVVKDYEVLVVDDGSTDKTSELAKKAGARVIRHPANRGYGKSLLTGFSEARMDWVLMIDADGSYAPEDAARLLPYAMDFDMVVGARQGSFFWGNSVQAFLRWIYLRLASFVAGEPIPDANSGLRLTRKDAILASMPVQCLGYSFSTTMTLSFLQGGRFVKFVPVAYEARKGKSKVRGLRDILRTLQIMVQVILCYNPLKFAVWLAFLPAAFVLLSILWSRLTMFYISVLATLFVFLFGCLFESLRLHRLSAKE